MRLCAALRSTHDLCAHAHTLSLTQRQIFTFRWDVGIGATGICDQYHGTTSSVPSDSNDKVTDLRRCQATQFPEGRQVLNHCSMTAGLPDGHATAGLFKDQSRHLRVLDLRRIEGQRDGGGQLAQVRVLALQCPERIHLPCGDG